MSTQALTRNNYDNCRIVNADNKLLFLCQERKLRWYVDKNLAEIISDDPLTAKLLFEPNGLGRHGDKFFLTARMNRCVVCKSEDNLTRHHVLPYCYSKFFPFHAKVQSSYDIVLLCIEHHTDYEVHAFDFKKELSIKHEVPLSGVGPTMDYILYKVGGLQNALTKHRDKIPEPKQQELLQRLCEYLGKSVTFDEIAQMPYADWRLKPSIPYGQAIIDCYDCLDQFAILWRKHFIDIMKPQFMPEEWDINRKIYSERN